MARPTNDRIIAALLIAMGMLSVLWVRCLWLQVLVAPRYAAYIRGQHTAAQVIQAKRGGVYDRHGRPLAVSVSSPSVFADARQVEEKRQVAMQLSRIVGRDARAIQGRLERDKRFVWVARQVNPVLTPSLLALESQGIGIREEPKRLYPQGRLAGHLVGFVDIDQRGLEGLELAFNGALQGQDGWRSTLRDAKGSVLIGPWTVETEPVPGHDLVLTIDSVVQQVAEEALEWGVKKFNAKGGSVIVMDPHTGELLALANSPNYDPNTPSRASLEHRRNRAVTDLFEPGSIFKILTAAALIEEGRITPGEQIFCENGAYPIPGRHILHDHRPHGLLSFQEVIALSSNIGTAKAAQRLTPEEIYRHIRAFGFGQRTRVDMPGEVSGIVPAPGRWSKVSSWNIPIGQGIAVTPIQLAVMTAVIANGGWRIQPYLVDRVRAEDGRLVHKTSVASPQRILRADTAAAVESMLVDVVQSGTGQLANVQGLTVAGKTGTAQKLEPTGRYSHSRFVASFVGFGPVPDVRFVIVVSVDEPRPMYFGGVVSAPVFKRIVEQLASYWELPRQAPRNVAQLPVEQRAEGAR